MTNFKDVKVGDTIRINRLNDDDGIPDPAGERYKGLIGKVTRIDEHSGTMNGTWGGLSILDVDDFDIISNA